MIQYNPGILSWRQQYNPLRGLTVGRLIFLLEAAERGIYSDLQWLYRFIEKRDSVIRALIERRNSALEKLDWDIKIKEVDEDFGTRVDQGKAQKQAEALHGAYDMIDNLREAISFLALAEFRGFAHVEKHFNADGDVFHLEPVEQWYWARRMPRADWLYNKRAQSTDNGYRIDPRNFIIRETRRPINEVAIICYLRKQLSHKDWDSYIETYGLPPIFIELPESAPAGLKDQYQDTVNKIIGDMRGVLPPGAKVQLVQPGTDSFAPFKEHIDYQDSQIVMAGTGGKLTMLNDPTGLGSGQSEVHSETFDEIAAAEAKQISELFQKQFDRAVLSQMFPGEPALAYFELQAEDEVDVAELVQNVVALKGAGYKADIDQIAEKTGLELEDFDEQQQQQQVELAKAQNPPGAPEPEKFEFRNQKLKNRSLHEANARKLVAEAQARDLEHVRNRIASIMQIENEDIRNSKLKAFSESLPKLLKDLNRDPEVARPLGDAMSAAYFDHEN